MDKSIKDRIRELKAAQLAENYLLELNKREKTLLERKEKIDSLINKRGELIDQLNSKSLLGNYFKILGKKNNALEISKQHYLELVLEYDEIINLIDKINFEKDILKNKVNNTTDLKRKLKEEIATKENEITYPKMVKILKIKHKIENKIGIHFEIEEAIKAGEKAIEMFDKALKIIMDEANNIEQATKYDKEVFDFNITKLESYQTSIINIQHSMLKFESEVNDIYKYMFKEHSRKFSTSDNFLGQHRSRFVQNLNSKNKLIDCYGFLKNQKKVIQDFLFTLGEDARSLSLEITKLESLENELLSNL